MPRGGMGMGVGRGHGRRHQTLPETDLEKGAPQRAISTWESIGLVRPYFWPEGGKQRLAAVASILLLALSKAASILSPLALGAAINQLANDRTVPVWPIVIYSALKALSTTLKEMQAYVYLNVQKAAYIDIARKTFRHLHSLSLDWHLTKRTGVVLRAMDRGISSANTVVRYLFLSLLPTVVECVVVCVIFLTHYSAGRVAVVAIGGVALYALVTYVLTAWRMKVRRRMNEHDNSANDKAVDSLVNFETVKYFTNEEYELERYTVATRQYQDASVTTQGSLNVLNSTQQIIIQAVTGGALMLMAYSIVAGELQIGDFTAITVYIMQLFQPLSFLGSIYSVVVQAFVDMRNLMELLEQHPDVQDAPGAPPLSISDVPRAPAVEFRDVWFRYPSQEDGMGLQGVSFAVPRGSTLGVVGHTGAGKSTISRLVFRFYDVQRGEVLVDGRDVRAVAQRSLRQVVGVVPQDTVLFNDTVAYNISYGRPGARRDEVEEAARAAQIHDFIMSLPKGYDTVVGERGLKLSGGEKQRVAIARTLLKNPPILVLDEATSALDTVTEAEVQAALRRVCEGRTTIVIAHRLSTIKDAHEILVMASGQVVERGTHAHLLELGGTYADMWERQSRAAAMLDAGGAAAAGAAGGSSDSVEAKLDAVGESPV